MGQAPKQLSRVCGEPRKLLRKKTLSYANRSARRASSAEGLALSARGAGSSPNAWNEKRGTARCPFPSVEKHHDDRQNLYEGPGVETHFDCKPEDHVNDLRASADFSPARGKVGIATPKNSPAWPTPAI